MAITWQIPPGWICLVFGHEPPLVEADRDDDGGLLYPYRIRWICPRCHRELGASS